MSFGNNQNIEFKVDMPNHTVATQIILEQLKKNNVITNLNEIVGVGHRVVLANGVNESVVITNQVKDMIRQMIKLAPLHNEPELKVIEIFEKLLPNVINVASFDNSFHTTIPDFNYTYPINLKCSKQHAIRRYGFHGNSYRYITMKMQEILNKKDLNLVVCHLGNGASICAIKNSKSYATSMGLTPTEGLMMGSRCGDIDPSIPLYLLTQNMTRQEIDDLLNKQSGVKGLIGSPDMRDLEKLYKNNDHNAKLCLKIYTNRVASYIVNYINQLENKVDAIIFTAGVGENSKFVIKNILDEIKIINLSYDNNLVEQKYDSYKLINSSSSKFPIYCVRTNEELMIANDTKAKLK
jgi:acetate kinase